MIFKFILNFYNFFRFFRVNLPETHLCVSPVRLITIFFFLFKLKKNPTGTMKSCHQLGCSSAHLSGNCCHFSPRWCCPPTDFLFSPPPHTKKKIINFTKRTKKVRKTWEVINEEGNVLTVSPINPFGRIEKKKIILTKICKFFLKTK